MSNYPETQREGRYTLPEKSEKAVEDGPSSYTLKNVKHFGKGRVERTQKGRGYSTNMLWKAHSQGTALAQTHCGGPAMTFSGVLLLL